MDYLLAGLSLTAAFLALSMRLMKHAKFIKEAARQAKWYRAAAIAMAIAGAGVVGTNIQGFATSIASMIPRPLTIFVTVLCASGVVLDCWGKDNHAGKGTAVIAFFVPLLLVIAPVSLLGINPDELVRGVKDFAGKIEIVSTDSPGSGGP
ncbi:hypothetical protein OG339_48150 (plasmid) [Streptosporangium sp. NBC_01495]|uniref:hypothetical protein n=1 Tax=Streptosporangium sp. NBC_01495 TaxID=2903899 RepID=UPI002E33C762|nr:hypothetical protein [Streptosporangium sp. NBC_01495]